MTRTPEIDFIAAIREAPSLTEAVRIYQSNSNPSPEQKGIEEIVEEFFRKSGICTHKGLHLDTTCNGIMHLASTDEPKLREVLVSTLTTDRAAQAESHKAAVAEAVREATQTVLNDLLAHADKYELEELRREVEAYKQGIKVGMCNHSFSTLEGYSHCRNCGVGEPELNHLTPPDTTNEGPDAFERRGR